MIRKVFFGVLIIGILFTGFFPKYQLNTSQWSFGGSWTSIQEIQIYMWMREELPKESFVYPLSTRDNNVISSDMYSCKYCEGVTSFRDSEPLSKSVDEWHDFLVENNYDYLLIDAGMTLKYGQKWQGLEEEYIIKHINRLVEEISKDNRFRAVYFNEAGVIFAIKKE